MVLETFTRWAADTRPWNGYQMSTCPRCLRAHRVENGTVTNPCRELVSDGYRIVVRDEPMSEYRRPLRSDDDPSDPLTPWVKTKPETDEPPF